MSESISKLLVSDGKLIGFWWRGSPWALGPQRKARDCWECGVRLAAGEQAFRPLDNSDRRMQRLCCACAREKVEELKK